MDRSLINKKNARKIRKLIYDGGGRASHEAFNRFVRNEQYCKPDILRLLTKCSKSIVNHFIENAQDEPPDFEGFMANPFEEKNGPDEIDRALSVAGAFAHTSTLVQTAFAAGMLYGKGIYENDILNSLEPAKSKSLTGPGPNIAIISSGSSKDIKDMNSMLQKILGDSVAELFELMGTDHTPEKETSRDEESEEDRGQTGEEGPELP